MESDIIKQLLPLTAMIYASAAKAIILKIVSRYKKVKWKWA